MLCPNCNAENRADAKFCGECGAGLAATCAVCGTPSEAGRKFCHQCGSPLGDAPAPVAAGVTALPRQSPATERRLVSILFADLVGLHASLGDARRREAEPLLAEARETFERLGAIPWLERAGQAAHDGREREALTGSS